MLMIFNHLRSFLWNTADCARPSPAFYEPQQQNNQPERVLLARLGLTMHLLSFSWLIVLLPGSLAILFLVVPTLDEAS